MVRDRHRDTERVSKTYPNNGGNGDMSQKTSKGTYGGFPGEIPGECPIPNELNLLSTQI